MQKDPDLKSGPTADDESKRILATTYFPEELPPEYLRRWRA
jgi:hypothetical protein